ncbi:MAG: ThiF family adenylyltransferase [Verrucomicrobiota bacterium JB024]|nr:ThiF family adenylyltransferase [Verrucomicrobiota bacterium JB024]
MVELISGRICRLRIAEGQMHRMERIIYHRYPTREWGCFFLFGYRSCSWGAALSVVEIFPPQAGELNRQSHIFEPSPGYIKRAAQLAMDTGLCLGVVHSHPEGCSTSPSLLDDDMDSYLADTQGGYTKFRPYLSIILSKTDDQVSFSGRCWLDGQWLDVKSLEIVGIRLKKHLSYRHHPSERDIRDPSRERLGDALGEASHAALRSAKIGIVGCSGTGSPAFERLVRAGVGSFVIVDPKPFKASNLERMAGSYHRHLGKSPAKVAMLRELANEIDPSIKVMAIVGNALDDLVLDQLLDCDIVLSCTDTNHSRAFLSDIGCHYLLPVIDVAVGFDGKDSRVSEQVVEFVLYGGEFPCAHCDERIDSYWMSVELMDEQTKQERREDAAKFEGDGAQYWRGEPPQLLTVGYLTGMVGDMLAGYTIGMLTGCFEMPSTRFQFDITMPNLGCVSASRIVDSECHCESCRGKADAAVAWRSVARPIHWPRPVFL